jgi:predicted transcriptional regulator
MAADGSAHFTKAQILTLISMRDEFGMTWRKIAELTGRSNTGIRKAVLAYKSGKGRLAKRKGRS